MNRKLGHNYFHNYSYNHLFISKDYMRKSLKAHNSPLYREMQLLKKDLT